MHRAFRERDHVYLFNKYRYAYVIIFDVCRRWFFLKDFFTFFCRFVEIPCTPTHTCRHTRTDVKNYVGKTRVAVAHGDLFMRVGSVGWSVCCCRGDTETKKYNLAKFAKTKTVSRGLCVVDDFGCVTD